MAWCYDTGDLFAAEMRAFKAAARAPKDSSAVVNSTILETNCSDAGAATAQNVGAAQTKTKFTIPDRVLGELLRYYEVHQPAFANPVKLMRICRSFRAKQLRLAAESQQPPQQQPQEEEGEGGREDQPRAAADATHTPAQHLGLLGAHSSTIAVK